MQTSPSKGLWLTYNLAYSDVLYHFLLSSLQNNLSKTHSKHPFSGLPWQQLCQAVDRIIFTLCCLPTIISNRNKGKLWRNICHVSWDWLSSKHVINECSEKRVAAYVSKQVTWHSLHMTSSTKHLTFSQKKALGLNFCLGPQHHLSLARELRHDVGHTPTYFNYWV